jgi:hypothetical protein
MTPVNPLRLTAFATSACALILLALALATGGSQGLFQLYAPVPDYSALLLKRASVLRLDIGIDLLFIAAYLSFFVLMARQLLVSGADRLLVSIALGLVMMTALLDAIENAHILAMLRAVENGGGLSAGQILAQQVASQVKFQAAYYGMAGLGLLWPMRAGWGWIKALFILQLVAGLGIFVVAGGALKLLYLIRATFFVIGPLLIVGSVKTTAANAPRVV